MPECDDPNLDNLWCLGAGDIGFGAVIALVPLLFGLWMKLLGGKAWRNRVGAWLYNASWSTAYAGLLQNLLIRLRWFFGRPWSPRALDMCLRLTVVYSMTYFLLVVAFPAPEDPIERLTDVGVFLVLSLMCFLLARKVRRNHLQAQRLTDRRGRLIWLRLREQLVYFIICLVILVLGLIVAIAALDGDVSAILIFSIPVALTGVLAGGGARAAVGTLTGIGALGGGVGFIFYIFSAFDEGGIVGTEGYIEIAKFGILFFLIPCLNTLFDWPSWAASRWLMQRLRADASRPGFFHRAGGLLAHLAIDGAIAIACLFGLAIALTNFSAWMDLPTLWDEPFYATTVAPFSFGGSILTVMLLSTLVPTALHLFFALFALAAIRPPYRHWFKGWLEEANAGDEWGNRAIVSGYLTFWMVFALAILWGAAVAVLQGLDKLWLWLGWGLPADPYPFWASIFRAAKVFVF
ncbi:MAG: hypothetical protein HN377_04815 [Alphaproteobacteria bacterium]|jgi:hypothetical protein|nr:hypothetical protein [Alphaproteobacteria bacterium]MBT7942203.1 hypothetical protein [Alphaproteobacteria bacterium]